MKSIFIYKEEYVGGAIKVKNKCILEDTPDTRAKYIADCLNDEDRIAISCCSELELFAGGKTNDARYDVDDNGLDEPFAYIFEAISVEDQIKKMKTQIAKLEEVLK